MFVLFFALPTAYFTIGNGGESGQTVGKRAFGIAVRADGNGGPLGYVASLGRFLVQELLGFLPIVGLLDVLAPLWDGRNRSWPDRIADSVVVRV